MRFFLKQTNARSFGLSLPDPEGRSRVLEFEYITDLSGTLERGPDGFALQSAFAHQLQISDASWNTAKGHFALGSPAAVSALEVDGIIYTGDHRGLPLEGRASLSLLDVEKVVVEGFGPRLTTGLRIEHLAVQQAADGGSAFATALALRELETSVAGFMLRLGTITADALRVTWGPAGIALSADALSISRITADGDVIDVTAEQITIPKGISFVDGQVQINELAIDKITVAIDLTALPPKDPQAEPRKSREPSLLSALDLRLLDRVNGWFEVDVTLDMAVPVIGRRRATHQFRVPIQHGTFNYKQLERGLATLEDTLIDFDVRNNKLVIERDLPIIRMRKSLVEWDLDHDELALARQRRVRLRTLPGYRILSSGGGGGNSDFKLNSLHVGPIAIELSVAGAGGTSDLREISAAPASAATSGDAARNAEPTTTSPEAAASTVSLPSTASAEEPEAGDAAAVLAPLAMASATELDGLLPDLSIGSLKIAGTLDYPQGQGLITLEVRQLATILRELVLGSMQLDVGAFAIDAIDPVQIAFDSLRPSAIAITISGLRLRDAKLRRRAEEAQAAEASDASKTSGT